MTQAVYTIKFHEGHWSMVVNSHTYGHFATEMDAVKMAIEAAREAGRFNAEGAKVIVERAEAGPQTIWSSGENGGP